MKYKNADLNVTISSYLEIERNLDNMYDKKIVLYDSTKSTKDGKKDDTKIAQINITEFDNGIILHRLWVNENYRRKGIATFLVGQVLIWAESNDIDDIEVKTGSEEIVRDGSKPDNKQLFTFYSNFTFLSKDKEKKITVSK